MLMRDGASGVEVLMLERRRGGSFSGAFVFPGGRVDDADRHLYARCAGCTDADASTELAVERDGLAYRVAAIRELFEESGVLLAHDEAGIEFEPARAERLADHREAVARGDLEFAEFLHTESLTIAADNLHYVSFWSTPEMSPHRFSTRFFVARLPEGQEADHDGGETVSSVWLSPSDALTDEGRRAYRLHMPTVANLEIIAGFSRVDDLMRDLSLRDKSAIEPILPVPVDTADGTIVKIPGDPDYPAWRARF